MTSLRDDADTNALPRETLSTALAELLRKTGAEPDVDTEREGVR
jgi:hypothetical protein